MHPTYLTNNPLNIHWCMLIDMAPLQDLWVLESSRRFCATLQSCRMPVLTYIFPRYSSRKKLLWDPTAKQLFHNLMGYADFICRWDWILSQQVQKKRERIWFTFCLTACDWSFPPRHDSAIEDLCEECIGGWESFWMLHPSWYAAGVMITSSCRSWFLNC